MDELNKQNQMMEMDWNDTIEVDAQEFILLPEGDYTFVVSNFERGRFPGSAKISPCNKAIITIDVTTDDGVAKIKFDLLLSRVVEWKISSFFRCLGLKKHGEKLVMKWDQVIGKFGRCHIKQRSYVNNYGETKFINDVDKFYDFDESLEISEDDLPF